MLKKIGFFLIVLSITILVNGCINQKISENNNDIIYSDSEMEIEEQEMETESLVGGQRDEHGCLGPAGYTWNEDLGACIREWELQDDQREAVKTISDKLDYEFTVVKVSVAKCPGCFTVELQRNDNREMVEVRLVDWQIKE